MNGQESNIRDAKYRLEDRNNQSVRIHFESADTTGHCHSGLNFIFSESVAGSVQWGGTNLSPIWKSHIRLRTIFPGNGELAGDHGMFGDSVYVW
jgi:hypothetical protein